MYNVKGFFKLRNTDVILAGPMPKGKKEFETKEEAEAVAKHHRNDPYMKRVRVVKA